MIFKFIIIFKFLKILNNYKNNLENIYIQKIIRKLLKFRFMWELQRGVPTLWLNAMHNRVRIADKSD